VRVQSLRLWLALRFAWVAALPLVVVAALVWLWLAPRIRADLEVHQHALARAVADQMETYLLGARSQIDTVAKLRRDLGQRPAPDWFESLDAYVGTGTIFEAIYVVDATDSVYAVGLSESRRVLREDLIGVNLSGWGFLRQARESNQPVWSEVFLSVVTGRLTVALAIPVADDIIVGEIAIEPLAVFLARLSGESDLAAIVLDHRGQVIARSQHTSSGQQLNLSYLPIVSDALQGQFATQTFELDGETLVGVLASVPQVNWNVLVAQPYRQAFRQVAATLWMTAAGLGVALLLATLAGWILARGFSRYFDRYAEQVHAVANGDYDRSWPTFRIAEFVGLTNNLRQMASAIGERERALVASEARFRDLSTLASDWFWEQDDQFRFTYFSSTLSQTTHIPPAVTLGKTRWELPIELTPAQWAAHRAVLEARQPFREFEYCIRQANGEEYWYSINGEPLFDDSGRFLGYRGTGREITERRRAEGRQRLAAAVFEAAREGILVADAERRIVAVNPAFTAMSGYEEAEVLGRNPRFLQSERQSEAHYAALWQAVVREGVWQGELWSRRKDGVAYLVLATVNEVRDAAGGLTHYVGIATDITQQKETEQRIERLAYYDALTDLPNRALLHQRAELALALAARRHAPLAVLFLDLDRFKEVNDSLGHAEGDALLVQVATRLRSLTRKTDTVCRLGGDEFVLLLPDADRAGALRVADKLLAIFRQPFSVAGHDLGATVSIGIALYPHDGADFAELLKNADAALYRAKRDGRNAWAFYDPEMNAAIFERLVLEGELRQAIAAGQLRAHYQPKVRLADGAPVGAEALVRWQHPERGLVPPGQFVPVAEASDLIVALGEWMLEEVCRQLAAWREAGSSPLTVAINLAARHFREPSLIDRVRGLLETYSLPPHALELEITESALVETEIQTLETLRVLDQLEIGLALDDFGTGYSSLSYLKRLPLASLKIDRSFVRDVATDPDDRTLAATIVTLGHQMGLVVVAEGVETEEQRRILLEQGCDLAQGYLFGRPMPAEQFAEWLAGASKA